MITPDETHITLHPLAAGLREQIPNLTISVANAQAIRGKTSKGNYEIHIFPSNGEIRTSFLSRGSNPLTSMELLCRNSTSGGEQALKDHLTAIKANEEKLPWIQREPDPETGCEVVRILPFGAAQDAPQVMIRTSTHSGMISLGVLNAGEMSPTEALIISKAINRACKIAALGPES
jgi:hypothetical protein